MSETLSVHPLSTQPALDRRTMLVKRKRSIPRETRQNSEQFTANFDDREYSYDTCPNDSSDERERTPSDADTSTDSSTRSRSNVWLYAHRHPTANGWAICDLCPSLPTPKRSSTKGGATSTLRKHLVKIHNKIELLLARQQCNNSEKFLQFIFIVYTGCSSMPLSSMADVSAILGRPDFLSSSNALCQVSRAQTRRV